MGKGSYYICIERNLILTWLSTYAFVRWRIASGVGGERNKYDICIDKYICRLGGDVSTN